jgi:hypothetical protein
MVTSTRRLMAFMSALAFATATSSTVQAHAPSCGDRHRMEYRYLFVHVTGRAKDAPPPTGAGDERIRIGYKHSSSSRVPLCSFIHEQDGQFTSSVPVDGAWLDLRGTQAGIRLHSSVVHGDAIDIDLHPNPRTLTIARRADGAVMEEGTYRVSPYSFTLK